MSATIADHVSGSGAGGNVTLTLPGGAPSLGEVLILVHNGNSGNDATKPASGQGGVTTWNEIISTVVRSSQVWYGVVDGTPAAGTQFNNQFILSTYSLLRMQGLDAASLIHGTPIANSASVTNPITTGSFTPTTGANVWLLATCSTSTGGTSGGEQSGGWTDFTSGTTGPIAYREVASASGSYGASWTAAAARSWDAQLVAFNVAAAATGRSPIITVQQAVQRAATW